MARYMKGTTAHAVNEMDTVEVNNWLYDKRVRGATLDQIFELAKIEAIRTPSGSYSNGGGLGKVMSVSTIRRRITAVLEAHRGDLDKRVEILRVLELDRLDLQLARLSDLVQVDQASSTRIAAENTILKIGESRRKLLGIDAPAQLVIDTTVTNIDGTSIELARMLQAMGEMTVTP